ncbi:hypothetical protein [Emticicia sp. 17c]|uniref:hypothetical protein n=1 Tax=Emticicia sp. 17c TaxID=3127704 RepID=UPI00301C09A0
MNLLIKFFLPVFIFTQSVAQTGLQSKKWILLTQKIEKSDIQLASYSPSRLKADTFVMQFTSDGKINYDYETNPKAAASNKTSFLDIDTQESTWEYEPSTNIITLNLKGGYTSLNDFRFKRHYKLEPTEGGYLLKKISDQYYDSLKNNIPTTTTAEVTMPVVTKDTKITEKPVLASETKKIPHEPVKEPVALAKEPEKEIVEHPKTIDFAALTKAMLIPSKRWILVGNKITKNVIKLTSFDKSKFRINTLVMSFGNEGKIIYDYESDPNIEFCAGIEFLDIDTDESAWWFDEENNVLTLQIKGGYASLDDFKFKRDYKVEQIGDEYVLHKVKEHYYLDLKKQNLKSRRK